LFGALRDEHRLDPRSELLLITAALLHEVGGFVSNRSHHKHSMYLILNSDIFGLGATDRLLTALIARYHRHALPKPVHEGYAGLSRDQRVLILKLAAILRVADALTRGGQEHRRLSAAVGPEAVTIALEGTGNLTVEEHALRLKGDLFEQVYGKRLILRAAGKEARYAAR
jgi:exopolyphosphatase/guanosine-5'-triphosphate,3'-diphosphate pyrophosphatase